MNNKMIITHYQEKLVSCLFEEDILTEIDSAFETGSILNHIYIGRVSKVVKNLEAAFVRITPELECYLPLREVFPVGRRLVEGDEILVQVTKDAIKTKAPSVSMNVSMTGKYLVFTKEKHGIGISNKLSRERRRQLKELTADWENPDYGMIVRTNAGSTADEEIHAEWNQMRAEFEKILAVSGSRTVYSCLYQSPPNFVDRIRDFGIDRIGQIVTDDQNTYDSILRFFPAVAEKKKDWLRFYEDSTLSLYKLYSLESRISEALSTRVWLKSGGYLVIEQTETLTVIDVNTGKFTGKKTSEETFFKVNEEAAKEAARQIRLRNLSGMILIDFINLSEKEKEEELIGQLRLLLKKDPVKADFIDMTGLKLVEITRRKVKRSLREQMG